jgi:branched-chain amino acid transport system substrate-binding protein
LKLPVPRWKLSIKYKAKYGKARRCVPAAGYDLAKVIEAAVMAAGSVDPAKVREGIANLENVAGATGTLTYGEQTACRSNRLLS